MPNEMHAGYLQPSEPVWDATQRDRLATEPSLVSRIEALRTFHHAVRDNRELYKIIGALIERADAALSRTSQFPTAYDAVWRALHEARHLQCEHGDAYQRLLAAAEIRADLEYHRDKKKLIKQLDEQIVKLRNSKTNSHDRNIGHTLVNLSTIAAEEREAAWRRANRTRDRLGKSSKWLTFCTVMLVVLIPYVLDSKTWPSEIADHVLIALCGATGGLLSGMFKRTAKQASSIESHLEQLKIKLRPLIGAISALLLRLFVLSGVIQIPGAGDVRTITPGLLILAIAAGFSERFIIERLERVANHAEGDDEDERSVGSVVETLEQLGKQNRLTEGELLLIIEHLKPLVRGADKSVAGAASPVIEQLQELLAEQREPRQADREGKGSAEAHGKPRQATAPATPTSAERSNAAPTRSLDA